MKEALYYEIRDRLEGQDAPEEIQGEFPTVAELKETLKCATIEQLAPVLIFFAQDPYDANSILEGTEAYQRTVEFCTEMVNRMHLEE